MLNQDGAPSQYQHQWSATNALPSYDSFVQSQAFTLGGVQKSTDQLAPAGAQAMSSRAPAMNSNRSANDQGSDGYLPGRQQLNHQ